MMKNKKMGYGKVGFGKDEMCSYKHTHNSAVHIAQRFNAISAQLQAQGIPAANIVQGAINFGVTGLTNSNQITFNIATTTATGIGTQTTTTTETATQTFEE